jgi:apolipoprotein D and lipocalin family protein
MPLKMIISTLSGIFLLAGCQASLPPLETVEKVELERFMGDWYVIANIPTFLEKGAFNAVESYHLDEDGTIATSFTFRQDAFDGREKRYTPRGFVRNTQTNAEWGMQFVWPFKGDYRIIYLAEDYSMTVIGRNKRDYVWVMARSPSLPESEFDHAMRIIEEAGYDTSQVLRVPQQW